MTLLDAIRARHSVRSYVSRPIEDSVLSTLQDQIAHVNRVSGLHMQLVLNEPSAFKGVMSYGKFHGVENYIAVVGPRKAGLDTLAGYYGEMLVLYAQAMGLNTCWVGLTYRKTKDAFVVADGEKLVCVIALGYGVTQGVAHKIKSVSQVSNVSDGTPDWFRSGVEAALLAPTAVNQQKFRFEYVAPANGTKALVVAKRGFSLFGYTGLDLGIAKCHFEIGAGNGDFQFAE